MWNLTGDERQRGLVEGALRKCDFPFDLLLPSLRAEGKTEINVGWQDLSAIAIGEEHAHEYDVHVLAVREAVLGLFYLPPNTRIVLDISLVTNEMLGHEVFLAEAAHAVDYHYMTNAMRTAFWDVVHSGPEDLNPGTTVTDTGNLHHGHSWFNGPAGYRTWVGEAWMEGFVRSFAPSVPVTIRLAHPTSSEAAATIRRALLPASPPTFTREEVELAAALRRATRGMPNYLRIAARNWLNSKEGL